MNFDAAFIETIDHNSLIELAILVMTEITVHQTTTHHAVIGGLESAGKLDEWRKAFIEYPELA